MRKKHFIIVLGLTVLVVFGLVYPFETTVVPAWKLRVTDEKGVPYDGLRVMEFWKHYSLEIGGGTNGEERWTDQNGIVVFPRRTIRMGIVGRLIRMALTSLLRYMHGSTGIRASVMVSGSQGIKTIKYAPNVLLTEELVLPRHGVQNENR